MRNLLSTAFKKVFHVISNSLSVILFVILWEIAPRAGWVPQTFIAPPSVILQTLWGYLMDGSLVIHVEASLSRSVYGFLLAGVVAVPLGFFLGGWFTTFERILNPVLRFLGQLNPFTLFPVFMLLFGIGEVSKIAMIFWVSIWPILYNTINGVKSTDPLHIKLARSMGAKKVLLFFKVILPSAAPYIFNGFKMSSGTAFFMLIPAEMLGASKGLGWLVSNAQVNYQIPKLFAGTIVILLLGLIINTIFRLLEKKIVTWRESPIS